MVITIFVDRYFAQEVIKLVVNKWQTSCKKGFPYKGIKSQIILYEQTDDVWHLLGDFFSVTVRLVILTACILYYNFEDH